MITMYQQNQPTQIVLTETRRRVAQVITAMIRLISRNAVRRVMANDMDEPRMRKTVINIRTI